MNGYRIVSVALLWGAVLQGACSHGGQDGSDLGSDGGTPDGGATHADMKQGGVCDGSIGRVADMASLPTGQVVPTGGVGTPCTADTDCTQGPTPSCWKQTVFDQSGSLPVAGGYCTSACATDSDCGTNNLCMDFGTSGKSCILGCGDAVTCRHPGYSCTFLAADANGNTLSGCFPNGNLDCNPESTTPCTDQVSGSDGACFRQAFEDANGGFCLPKCKLGDLCGTDIFNEQLSCIVVDFTPGGDPFRGSLCFPVASSTPTQAGASCQFINECEDGYQCDNGPGGSNKCTQLCNLTGTTHKCQSGTTCQDVYGLCTGPGLCK